MEGTKKISLNLQWQLPMPYHHFCHLQVFSMGLVRVRDLICFLLLVLFNTLQDVWHRCTGILSDKSHQLAFTLYYGDITNFIVLYHNFKYV